MDTKTNRISDNELELEVTLLFDEFKDDIEKAYLTEKENIAMPGFRKGKVPMGMLKKMYGEAIEYKASEDIANNKFWDAVKDADLEPVSTPQLVDIDYKKGEQLTFKVKFQVKPELELTNYKDQDIEKIIFTTRNEDIEAELDKMRKQLATFEPAESIADNMHRMNVDLQRVDADGNPMEGQQQNMGVDLSEENVNPQIVDNATGKKVGDKFSFNFVDNRNVEGQPANEEYNYEVTINAIEKIIPAEFTEEFCQQMSRNRAKTEEELRNVMKEDFDNYNKQQTEQIFENSLVTKIVANNDFTPPSGYVETLLNNMLQSEIDHAKKHKQKVNEVVLKAELEPRAEFAAKWHIVSENIARIEDIKVTDDDLKAMAEKDAEKTGISVEKLINYYKESKKGDNLIDEKIMNFLKENNNIKEITAEEKTKQAEEEAKKNADSEENKDDK